MAVETRQKIQIMGNDGTNPLDIAVCSSGEVKICLSDIASLSGIVTLNPCVNILRIGSYVQLNSISGGSPLAISGQWNSGPTINLMIKNMSGNTDVFLGGSGQPYSGHGYALTANEKIEINVCNPLIVYGFASNSGQLITFIGLDD